jgi:hypothetical protein
VKPEFNAAGLTAMLAAAFTAAVAPKLFPATAVDGTTIAIAGTPAFQFFRKNAASAGLIVES